MYCYLWRRERKRGDLRIASTMELVSSEDLRAEKFPVGMRVLAVDDNPTCLRKLEELLLRCNYLVTKTMESKKALELLREKSNMFDLVISDVEMPDMDGFKLLEIGLEMDLPVIMLSAHSDYDSVMKGIIHGACDYLVKPVGLKELQNIWRHVVKKNTCSYAKNIGPSYQMLQTSESNLIPSVSKKRKDIVSDSGVVSDSGDENDSGREEEDAEASEQDGEESSTRKKPRVVWSQELHKKFVNAVQQLGLDKAVPKKILDLMNVEGLTRENVASHLQKYRLYLKKIDENQQQNLTPDVFGTRDSSYFQMGQLDGFRDFTATRQLPSSVLLSRSHLNKFHPSMYSSINLQGIKTSSFIQQGHHQNSSISANLFGTYHTTLLPRIQNTNLLQRTSSPLEPLQFSTRKCSAYMGDFNSVGDRAIGGSFLDSCMSFGSSSTSLPSASSNTLMSQANYTQPLHRTSDGDQPCIEGTPYNFASSNFSIRGLSTSPSHSFLDSCMSFGSSSTSLPSASSNTLMLQANYTQPLHRTSDGDQPCIEGTPSNFASSNFSIRGLSTSPSHSFLDSCMSFGSSSTSLPSASSNTLMLQANYTQPLHRASDGDQPCIERTPSNYASSNISIRGLSTSPSHSLSTFPSRSWQGNFETSRFPSNSLPLNHAFLPDQGKNVGDCTSLVSADNLGEEIQCEPQLLGDLMHNKNTLEGQKWEEQNCTILNNPFGNVEYPLPADNMVFRDNNATRSKGLNESLTNPTDGSATTLNGQEYVGKPTMLDRHSSSNEVGKDRECSC